VSRWSADHIEHASSVHCLTRLLLWRSSLRNRESPFLPRPQRPSISTIHLHHHYLPSIYSVYPPIIHSSTNTSTYSLSLCARLTISEPNTPFADSINAMKDRGVKLIYGRWLIEGAPRVLLFDTGSCYDRYVRFLISITTPQPSILPCTHHTQPPPFPRSHIISLTVDRH
jgi:hypothetical protein